MDLQIAKLMEAMATLGQGLVLVAETQDAHTEMLRKLLEAATEKPDGSPLHDAMVSLEATLAELARLIEALPEVVADRLSGGGIVHGK